MLNTLLSNLFKAFKSKASVKVKDHKSSETAFERDTRSISPELVENIRKAISILSNIDGSSDDEMIKAFCENGINKVDAKTIITFLPIAFCRRLLLGELKFEDDFVAIDQETRKWTRGKLSKTPQYLLVWNETETYFSSKPGGENILKIGGRSSEFHVINELLNHGGKLEEIKLTPLYISW